MLIRNLLNDNLNEKVKIGTVPYIEIGDINIETKKYSLKDKGAVGGAKYAYKNNILVSTVRPTRGAITIVNENKIAVSSAFTILNVNEKICNYRFLFYYLNNEKFFEYLGSNSKGATYPTCSKDDVLDYEITLPGIDIQNKIVSLFDNITKNIFLKNEQINLCNNLIKSQFVEMFEDSNLIKLGELAKISRGASPRPINRYITSDEKGINWIKIGDVSDTSLYITNAKEKITELGALKSKKVYNGDFILSNSMSFGRPYILRIDGCVHDGWLIISDFKKSFNELYLYYALRDEYVQKQFKRKVNGTTVKNLNSDLVKSTYIKVPPIELQNKFAQIVEQIDKQKFEFEKSLKKLEELQAALMQEYFG